MRTSASFTLPSGDASLSFRVMDMSAVTMESWLQRAHSILHDQKTPDVPLFAASFVLQNGMLPLYAKDFDQAAALDEEMLCTAAILRENGEELPLSSEIADLWIDDVRVLLQLRSAILRHQLRFCREGARKPLKFPKEWAFRKAVKAHTFAAPVNIPEVTGAVVSQGMASTMDMQAHYGFTDALNMLELLNVRNYNQWAAMEAAKRGRK